MTETDQIVKIHVGNEISIDKSRPLRSFANIMNTIGEYLLEEESTDIENDEVGDLGTFLNILFVKATVSESRVDPNVKKILKKAYGKAAHLKDQLKNYPKRVRSASFLTDLKDIGVLLLQVAAYYEEQ